jgi:hypothetical protein
MASSALLEAVAVTAELCGRVFSPAAARVFVEDLAAYPERQVLGALRRCRKEVKGILTTQDVVSRLDDGRLGAEEAWAMLPKSEAESVVWTTEMAEALRVAQPLLDEGDRVAARMAFKQAYDRLVAAARDAGRPVDWQPSLGHDPRGREQAIREAVERGRLSVEYAQTVCPTLPAPSHEVAALLEKSLAGHVIHLQTGAPRLA